MRLLKQVLSFALDFFVIYAKMTLTAVLGRNLFSIANDCCVNPSDLSKMLVKKQMKYFDVRSELPCMESSGFTRTFKYKNE